MQTTNSDIPASPDAEKGSLLRRLRELIPFGRPPDTTEALEHEIQELLEEGEEHGLISSMEEQMISSIFDFRDTLAAEIMTLADGYSHLLGPSTTFGKDLMPRIAALAGVNQVSDIMEVDGPSAFKRPVYAGNAIIDVTVPAGSRVVATVRTASWKAVAGGGSGGCGSSGGAVAGSGRGSAISRVKATAVMVATAFGIFIVAATLVHTRRHRFGSADQPSLRQQGH